MTDKPINRILVVSLLLSGSALSVMSTDLYTPSLPHLPKLLNTSAEMVQLTLVCNILAFGLAQLFLGPLSDKIGRRPVFIGGILLFTVFSLACGLATSIGNLILARTLQGAAGAAEAVMFLAVLTDIFDEKSRVKVMAIYGVLFAIAPGVAPLIGGHIHVNFGWRANFYLLSAIAAIVVFITIFALPETGSKKPDALKRHVLLGNYMQLLKNRGFMLYSLMLALVSAILFAFIVEAPFILIDHFGVATEHFGYYQLGVIVVYAIGSFASMRLINHISSDALLKWGMILVVVGTLLLLAPELWASQGKWAFMAAFAVIMFATGPLWSVLPAVGMSQATTATGSAAALFGAIEISGGGLGAALAMSLHDGATLSLAITELILVVLLVGLYVLSARLNLKVNRVSENTAFP
ncbi:MAG: multidrug effflux MFS transporter [Pseudomonadales bacterium]